MSIFHNDAGELVRGRDPLFPPEAGSDPRNVRFVTFAVLHKNVELRCLEEFSADNVRCWDDVYRLMGPGLYRAFGKDEHHRLVAVYPPRDGDWIEIGARPEPRRFPDGDLRSSLAAFMPPPLDARSRATSDRCDLGDRRRGRPPELIAADTEAIRAMTAVIRSETARIEAATEALTAALAASSDAAPIAMSKADLREVLTALYSPLPSMAEPARTVAEIVKCIKESSSTSEPASLLAEITRIIEAAPTVLGEHTAVCEPTTPIPDEAGASNGLPKWADKPHPIFPHGGTTEPPDIRSVRFIRLREDGAIIAACPNAFAAGEIRDWKDVMGLLGAGFYRAIGVDANGRLVAEYPRTEAGWLVVVPWAEPSIHKQGPWTNAILAVMPALSKRHGEPNRGGNRSGEPN